MPDYQEYPDFEKVLVLGRGLEQNGQITFDSPVSGDSYDRSSTAGQYVAHHAEGVKQVIFSGGHSFVLDATYQMPDGSEAKAMYDNALGYGLPSEIKVEIEDKSLTTYDNFLRTAHYFQPGDVAGLITHRDHSERALQIGRKVLPKVTFRPIYADNLERATVNQASKMGDRIAKVLYGAAMAPVRSGDLRAIGRQDKLVRAAVGTLLKAQTHLSTALSRDTIKY